MNISFDIFLVYSSTMLAIQLLRLIWAGKPCYQESMFEAVSENHPVKIALLERDQFRPVSTALPDTLLRVSSLYFACRPDNNRVICKLV